MALARPAFAPKPIHVAAARSRHAWRLPVIGGGLMLGLTLPPLVLALFRAPAGALSSGYVVVARDALVYQAMWRQGWRGAWLFQSAFTSESLPGILLYPWYLWPAHLVGWAAGPWLYHTLRLLGAAALVGALWLLIVELFHASIMRRWAFVLCTLGGGVGLLLPREIHLGSFVTHATETRSPGSSVADLIAMAPHLPWAVALMCWLLVVGLRLRRRAAALEILSGLAAAIGLQLIYPQLAILAVAILIAWSLVRRYRHPLLFALGAGVVQAPYLLYLLWVSRTSPAALAVIRPSLDVGDPFGFIVLSHLVATALIVLALARRKLRGDLLLPALWIVGMTLFMFAPEASRVLSRSFMASSIPFGLCAAPGLLSLLRSLRSRAWRRRLAAITFGASSLYGIFSLAQPYWIAAFRLDPQAEYERADEATILARLAPRVTSRDVILTTYLDGLFVPAQTDARAYVGHPEMTIDAPGKAAEALAFFTDWTPGQRSGFLRANGIDYVLATDPRFVDRLMFDPGLILADRQGSAALFELSR